jgi:hypothetical protein
MELSKELVTVMTKHFEVITLTASDSLVADNIAEALNAICDIALLTLVSLEEETVDEVLIEMTKKIKEMYLSTVKSVDI